MFGRTVWAEIPKIGDDWTLLGERNDQDFHGGGGDAGGRGKKFGKHIFLFFIKLFHCCVLQH